MANGIIKRSGSSATYKTKEYTGTTDGSSRLNIASAVNNDWSKIIAVLGVATIAHGLEYDSDSQIYVLITAYNGSLVPNTSRTVKIAYWE